MRVHEIHDLIMFAGHREPINDSEWVCFDRQSLNYERQSLNYDGVGRTDGACKLKVNHKELQYRQVS